MIVLEKIFRKEVTMQLKTIHHIQIELVKVLRKII